MDDARPEAEALAVAGDRILLVGSDAEVERTRGPETEVVDLQGRLAIPGFIEGHAHLLSLGASRVQLDLLGTTSYRELIDRVAAAVAEAEPGEWIVGRGWHQSKWDPPPEPAVRGFPLHGRLSAASPDNPVWLRHASGHASLANARAMELAGVTAAMPDPPGGEVLRAPGGELAGVFVETASDLIRAAYDAAREAMSETERYEESRRHLRLAVDAGRCARGSPPSMMPACNRRPSTCTGTRSPRES